MKTVLVTNPIFTPGSAGVGTLDFSNIPGFVNRSLMAVINQTQNAILYAEAQPGYGFGSLSGWDSTGKILTLGVSTVGHKSTDLLQVIYDSASISITPVEEQYDPINRQRVSQPQSLIDTDFEYGLQPTKWELVSLINNKPTGFYNSNLPLTIGALSGSGTRTVTVSSNIAPGSATPIYIQDPLDYNASGWFLTDTYLYGNTTTPNIGNIFTYTTLANTISGTLFDPTKTYIFQGNFYTGAGIPTAPGTFITTNGTASLTATTLSAHGLTVNDQIILVGLSGNNTSLSNSIPNGTWTITSTPSANTIIVSTSGTVPAGTVTNIPGISALYARPAGYSIHRAFDGGVFFTCGNTPNAQMIRQTRRYFRYQAGKGITFSTGTNLKPAMFINTLTSNYTTSVTANAKFPTGVTAPGQYIIVTGSTDPAYNGTYAVQTTLSPTSFVYNTTAAPLCAVAPGFPVVSPASWYGQITRIGMCDLQNGAFFEHDGQTLYVVRRSSTNVIAGTVATTQGSSVITGTSTLFANQLTPGDYIVIRGQSYRVLSIQSNTQLTISPEYRGTSISGGAVVCKTIDTRIPQSQWNLDKMDGTGASAYNLDLTKMQMFVIDYSWYGAGFIRWGVRGVNGNYTYCHKMINNNVNTVAYMRAGNLPAHYEENTLQPITTITNTVNSTDNVINVASTFRFPPNGTARIVGSNPNSPIEYISYSGLSNAPALTGVTRGQTGGTSAQIWTFSPTQPISVELASAPGINPPAAALSHWGSSVIMDGQYQTDLVYSFNTGSYDANNNGTPTLSAITTVAKGATIPLLSLRLAPSVDSGKTGLLGAKEVINRMQLRLQSMDALTNGTFRLSLVLNPQITTTQSWQSVVNPGTTASSSLAQVCYHSSTDTLSGGESVFGFFTASNSNTGYNETTYDLSTLRDLGTSILGGGLLTSPSKTAMDVYPDGPDVLTITATNLLSSSAGISTRLSWQESQA
jgi:hypothetical protein